MKYFSSHGNRQATSVVFDLSFCFQYMLVKIQLSLCPCFAGIMHHQALFYMMTLCKSAYG